MKRPVEDLAGEPSLQAEANLWYLRQSAGGVAELDISISYRQPASIHSSMISLLCVCVHLAVK